MASSAIKDVSPDDIYYMTWLIECIEYDDNGDPYRSVYHETISQDYYIPEADYVLSQKANDNNLLSQIDRLWALEGSSDYPNYSTLSAYLKDLAYKFVHKQCVRHGSQNIHSYFEDWINHTKGLLSVEGDRLSYIVYNYDIDEFVKIIRTNLKRYSMILFKPTGNGSAQSLKIRLNDFFAIEEAKQLLTKTHNDEIATDRNSHYNIEKITSKIDKLYDFAVGDVFTLSVTKSQFNVAIETANFSKIYSNHQTLKSKLKLILKEINIYLGDKYWYRDVAKSIGLTPSKCSGANPNDDEWIAKLKNLK